MGGGEGGQSFWSFAFPFFFDKWILKDERGREKKGEDEVDSIRFPSSRSVVEVPAEGGLGGGGGGGEGGQGTTDKSGGRIEGGEVINGIRVDKKQNEKNEKYPYHLLTFMIK